MEPVASKKGNEAAVLPKAAKIAKPISRSHASRWNYLIETEARKSKAVGSLPVTRWLPDV
jgi:hypothetical protein